MLKKVAKFVIAFFVMTLICIFVWQRFVYGSLYYCSDPLLDFLNPGDWVHVIDGQPVQVVSHVVAHQLFPVDAGGSSWVACDTIKQGWSVSRLWHLWFLFVSISFAISFVLSFVRWIPKSTPPNTALEPTPTAP